METALETDADSRLGTYYRVNPTLEKYVPKPQPTLEIERELVTRYRTGSHSLAIELGRYSNTPRENRVCCCGMVQSVWHLFTECPLTLQLVDHQRYNNLSDVFGDGDVHRKLLMMCSKLKIAIWLKFSVRERGGGLNIELEWIMVMEYIMLLGGGGFAMFRDSKCMTLGHILGC